MRRKMAKTFLQHNCNCSMQKAARKNSYYERNETILKIGKVGHQAKAIDFGKSSVWVKY